MPWFRVDDQLYGHPKWISLKPPAKALWISAGSWCAAHLSDGLVPAEALSFLGASRSAAAQLVEARLWHEEGDGYRFHEWDQWQPTREEVMAERRRNAERIREWRQKKREGRQGE
jgi:hypothetical protein